MSGDNPEEASEEKTRRKIEGNLPYATSVGVFTNILQKMISAERPDKFSADFVDKVLGFSGGSARAAIPILKKVGFLSSDGTPTDLYSKFKTENGRAEACYQALKNGFSEIFRKSEYAHKANDTDLKDIIVEITGLPANDKIIGYIASTFSAFNQYIDDTLKPRSNTQNSDTSTDADPAFEDEQQGNRAGGSSLGLSYQINIVLPETSDIKVFDAIFKSLKSNLL